MCKRSGKILLLPRRIRKLLYFLVQVVRHQVKITCQNSNFILSVYVGTRLVIPFGKPPCRIGQFHHRAGEQMSHHKNHHAADANQCQHDNPVLVVKAVPLLIQCRDILSALQIIYLSAQHTPADKNQKFSVARL